MSRSAVALSLLGWLAAGAAHSQFSRYLEFDIGFETRENGDLYSAAAVTCFGFFGYDSNCLFNGQHYIFDALTGAQISGHFYSVPGQYSGFVRTRRFGDGDDHCYRAFVDGRVLSNGYYNYERTFQRCYAPLDPIETYDCPILVDLDSNGFHLSGVEEAVSFDLDADGFAELLAWTQAGERDGFLCRDLNGNGAIDDGRELFGRQTPLASGESAQIAYRALAELDLPELGGNSDGGVGPEDAAFQELCVWVDENHDGISQPGEIASLRDAGLLRLGYDFIESRHRDAHNNLFRYKSRGWIMGPGGRERVTTMYDVFFVKP